MNEKKRKSRRRRKAENRMILAIIIAAAVAIAAVILVNQRSRNSNYNTSVSGDEVDQEVTYNGDTYHYNNHLSNYLFMGIDTMDHVKTYVGRANAGQADALFLVSVNRQDGTVKCITIPRDTMTEIETFSLDGESLGKSVDHISLSYAYGDGYFKSCRLTKDAVSNLFHKIPIQGYCSITRGLIAQLAEALGDITVTVPNESLVTVDSQFQPGAQVTLNADNTETFLHYRDVDLSQSALGRQERHVTYLKAVMARVKEKTAEDSGYISDLYTQMKEQMVTNMESDNFAEIAENLTDDYDNEIVTVPGQGGEGVAFDEYYVDDDALEKLIIDTFYIKN